MIKIDLHIHSNYSDDGELSLVELLRLGQQTQLDYMAITDHNSVEGVSETMTFASQFDMQMLSGIELDCVHHELNFHLLGYGFDHTNPIFIQIRQDIMIQEKAATRQKIELLQNMSFCCHTLMGAQARITLCEFLLGFFLIGKSCLCSPPLYDISGGGAVATQHRRSCGIGTSGTEFAE